MVYENVRNYLNDIGVKYSYVARGIGVGDNTFSMMMSGKRKISADEFVSICRVLNVSPAMFVKPAETT